MANLIQKILSVLAWFFGIMFILVGIIVNTENGAFMSNSLMVIGGILLLPPIKRLALETHSTLTKGRLTILAVILIFSGIIMSPTEDVDQTASTDSSQNLVEKEDTQGSDDEEVGELVLDELSSEDMSFEEDVEVYDDSINDVGYEVEEYEGTQFSENTRSKFPALSLEFSFLVQQRLLGGPLELSIVSRNKQPVLVYDIIINDGVNCPIYGGKEVTSGVMSYGEKYQFSIVGCDLDQIVEIKIITEKGYVAGDIEML